LYVAIIAYEGTYCGICIASVAVTESLPVVEREAFPVTTHNSTMDLMPASRFALKRTWR